MPTDPAAAPESAATHSESDISKLVSEEIGKQLNGRLFKGGGLAKAVQEALSASLPALVEQHVAKIAANHHGDQQQEPAGNSADGKITVKALQEQSEARIRDLEKKWQAKFDEEAKARQAAEQKAVDAKARSAVQAMFSKHLGSDNPNVGLLMDSWYDVKKRFGIDAAGNVVVKFKRDGYDDEKPLEEGFGELLQGELKSYIPAKAAALPSNGLAARTGSPVSQPGAQANGKPRYNPLLAKFGRDIAEERPEIGLALLSAAGAPPDGRKQ